jgi:hypothetical protein
MRMDRGFGLIEWVGKAGWEVRRQWRVDGRGNVSGSIGYC